jgi:hypothetical protein
MVYFQTTNSQFGSIVEGLPMEDDGTMYLHMAIWSILWPFGIFHANLIYSIVVWYYFSGFGMLYQEKSGEEWFCERSI